MAVEMLVEAIQSGTVPAERSMTTPVSIPSLDLLATSYAEKTRALSAGQ
jgi:hypothetical protein